MHASNSRAGSRLPFRASALALAIAIAFTHGLALAGPADFDDPLIHPRIEIDPRLDFDERPGPQRSGTAQRAPLWIGIGGSYMRGPLGDPAFGAMLLLGVPFERIAAPGPRTVFAEAPAAEEPAPKLKPVPHAKSEPPPGPAPKIAPEPSVPLRIPVVVTPEAARTAVDAALRRAHLADPGSRLDAMATRARRAAMLPELRLRALRTVDQGQSLMPTEYDPYRTTQTGGSSIWMEARATWRLDRLVFADEEVSLERMRHDRAEAQARLTERVLKLLFAWQRAMALADNPAASPEEVLVARLRALETEAEVDLLTGGWFCEWRAKASDVAKRVDDSRTRRPDGG